MFRLERAHRNMKLGWRSALKKQRGLKTSSDSAAARRPSMETEQIGTNDWQAGRVGWPERDLFRLRSECAGG